MSNNKLFLKKKKKRRETLNFITFLLKEVGTQNLSHTEVMFWPLELGRRLKFLFRPNTNSSHLIINRAGLMVELENWRHVRIWGVSQMVTPAASLWPPIYKNISSKWGCNEDVSENKFCKKSIDAWLDTTNKTAGVLYIYKASVYIISYMCWPTLRFHWIAYEDWLVHSCTHI